MTVLQFRPPSRTPGPAGGPGGGRASRPRVPVRGTFTTPDLSTGSMDGWLRVLHCSVPGSSLRCLAVISGTLFDARGQRLGLASTRCLLPVTIRSEGQQTPDEECSGTVLVGPVQVNLLGLEVHVDQIRVAGWEPTGGQRQGSANVMPLPGRRRA